MFEQGNELRVNKTSDIEANKTSIKLFPNVKAVYDWVSGLFVKGVVSSTDNALVRWDGTTGKLVQDSGVVVDDAGNVGIGTTNTTAKVHIAGSARIEGAFYDATNSAGTAGHILTTTGTGTAWANAATALAGTLGGINDLTDAQNNATYNNLFIGHNGFTGTYYNNYNTAIGIGALDNPNTDNTNANFGDNNTAMGYQGLTSNTTGSNNSAHGMNALFSNTTGSSNSAQGMQALLYNTTGSSNSAQGVNALFSNTIGSNNSAQGMNALFSNTKGSSNSAQGMNALFSNTKGSSNLGAGYNAARYIADGSTALTVANQGVFLGTNTKALADNSTNEIVIGYNTVGNGSNTVTLGNDNVIQTNLKGEVSIKGIGATSATSSLLVKNSNNSQLLKVQDNGLTTIAKMATTGSSTYIQPYALEPYYMCINGAGADVQLLLQRGANKAVGFGASTGGSLRFFSFSETTPLSAVKLLDITSTGKLGIGPDIPTASLDIQSDTLRLRTAKTPASATDTGNAGDICWDANYMYVCVAINTWKRTGLTTW